MKKHILLIVLVVLIVLLVMFGPRLLSELIWHRSMDATMFELQLRMAGRDAMNGDEAAWYAAKAEKNAGPMLLPEDMEYPPAFYSKGGMDYYVLNAQEHSEYLIVYFAGGTYIDRPQAEHWAFVDALAAFIKEIGLPTTFAEMGISDDTDYKAIVESTVLTGGCAKKFTREELLEVLLECR